MNSQQDSAPVKRRSWKRRALRWFVVTLLSSIVSVTIWNLLDRERTRRGSDRELAAAVAAADRDDPDWSWDRLSAARRRPPEGKNGAELIPRIKKLSRAEWGTALAKEEWKTRLEVPPNVRFSPAVIAQVRQEATDSADAIALARALKDRSSGHREIVLAPNVVGTLLTDTQDTRHAADLLRWDGVLAVEDGDTHRAADDVRALLNASRSIGDETFLISQLVRMALRSITVRQAEWLLAQTTHPPALAELQDALAADAEEPLLLYGVRGERAAFDRLFENLESGATTPEGAIDPSFKSAWGRIGWWHYIPHLRADRADFLQWMTVCVGYARRPVHEQPALFATVSVPPKDPSRILSRLLLPAVDRVANAHWRTTAEARCAVAGIACERSRQQHKRWPDALAELVPAFIPAVPLDPYDGQPLRFAKSDVGIVVYSVGKRPPAQFGAPAPVPEGLPEGIEFGFRLWNPDQRRLPPLPDPPQPEREPPP